MRCYAPPPPCGSVVWGLIVNWLSPPFLWACGVGCGKFTSKQMLSDAFRLVMLN